MTSALLDRFDRFWFARAPSDRLAVVRIFLGLSCVIRSTGLYGLGPRIVLDKLAVGLPIHRYSSGSWRFDDVQVKLVDAFPTLTLEQYHTLEAAALWLGVLFMLGVGARVTGPLLGVVLLATQLFDQAAFKHNIFTLGLAILVVGLSPCSDRFSVDAALSLRGRRSTVRSVLPVRMLQVMVSAVYLFSFKAKLNSSWTTGYLFEFTYTHLGGADMAVNRWLYDAHVLPLLWLASSWGTLVVELFLVFGFWRRRFLPYAIAAGVVMHAVIDLSLDVGSFSSTMIALYCAFLPASARTRLVRVRSRAQALVVRALDWAAHFDVVVAPSTKAIAVLDRDGAVVVDGRAAFWHVVERLPLAMVFGVARRAVVDVRGVVQKWRKRSASA